jgi:hypothetical protein
MNEIEKTEAQLEWRVVLIECLLWHEEPPAGCVV